MDQLGVKGHLDGAIPHPFLPGCFASLGVSAVVSLRPGVLGRAPCESVRQVLPSWLLALLKFWWQEGYREVNLYLQQEREGMTAGEERGLTAPWASGFSLCPTYIERYFFNGF